MPKTMHSPARIKTTLDRTINIQRKGRVGGTGNKLLKKFCVTSWMTPKAAIAAP
jgi:hypothetical protein